MRTSNEPSARLELRPGEDTYGDQAHSRLFHQGHVFVPYRAGPLLGVVIAPITGALTHRRSPPT